MVKIVWDAGHGYNSPGKRVPDGSMREWEFNSAVVRYAMEELSHYENVAQLRVDDPSGKTDVPLKERTDRANSWGADVYVSGHANGFGSGGFNNVSGIETFIHPKTPQKTVDIATSIHNSLIKATCRTNRGLKRADFHVLRETNMSAVLVECEFMTNKEASELLKSDSYRHTCASAIVQGLVSHYNLKQKPKPLPPQETPTTGLYKVQVGAFKSEAYAEKLAAEVKAKGFHVYIVKE